MYHPTMPIPPQDDQGAPFRPSAAPRAPERAITAVEAALRRFEFETGLTPRVVLAPRWVFSRYLAEKKIIDSARPHQEPGSPPGLRHTEPEWADVRLVEHENAETLEVY